MFMQLWSVLLSSSQKAIRNQARLDMASARLQSYLYVTKILRLLCERGHKIGHIVR